MIRSRGIRICVALILFVGMWLYWNPIRLHQKVEIAGVTVPVPFGWVMSTTRSQMYADAYVNIRRVPIPFLPIRPWITVMISRGLRTGEPYTMDSARRAQAKFFNFYGNTAFYSNQRTFGLSAGKFPSLCAGATMHVQTGNSQMLSCFVVGTPLQFNFMGSQSVDYAAERMLASLN